MSSYIEVVNATEMKGLLLQDGEVIATYKMASCDSCLKIVKLDEFGYQKGQGGEKLLWLCGSCR